MISPEAGLASGSPTTSGSGFTAITRLGDGIVSEQRDRSGLDVSEVTHLVNGKKFTRRQVLGGAAAVGGLAVFGPLASACGGGEEEGGPAASPSAGPKKGGSLRVGIVGGSAKDTADPHVASFEPDIGIQSIMYQGLATFDMDSQIVNQLAEYIEANADGSVWQCKLQAGLTWHDGKPITADDVVFSFKRIVDPKEPKGGAASLSSLARAARSRSTTSPSSSASRRPTAPAREPGRTHSNMLVPVGFDPKKPVGCGPFKLTDFKPGELVHVRARSPTTWTGSPWVDELKVIEFADDDGARQRAQQRRGRGHHAAADAPRPRSSRAPTASC